MRIERKVIFIFFLLIEIALFVLSLVSVYGGVTIIYLSISEIIDAASRNYIVAAETRYPYLSCIIGAAIAIGIPAITCMWTAMLKKLYKKWTEHDKICEM